MRRGKALLALFLVIVAVNVAVFPTLARRLGAHAGGSSFLPLDLRFGYSRAEAIAALASLGEAGRRLYLLVEISVDVIYPVLYGIFLFLLLRHLLGGPGGSLARRGAAFLPLMAMTLDLVENAFVVALIVQFPTLRPGLVAVASATTAVKLVCFGLAIALAVTLAARWVITGRRARAPASC